MAAPTDLNSILASYSNQQQQQQYQQAAASQQRMQMFRPQAPSSFPSLSQAQGVNQAQIQALMAAVSTNPGAGQQQQQPFQTRPNIATYQQQQQQAQNMAVTMQAMSAQAMQAQRQQQQQQQAAQQAQMQQQQAIPSFAQQQQQQQMPFSLDSLQPPRGATPHVSQPQSSLPTSAPAAQSFNSNPTMPSMQSLLDYCKRKMYMSILNGRKTASEQKMRELDAPEMDKQQARMQLQRDLEELQKIGGQAAQFEQTWGGVATVNNYMAMVPKQQVQAAMESVRATVAQQSSVQKPPTMPAASSGPPAPPMPALIAPLPTNQPQQQGTPKLGGPSRGPPSYPPLTHAQIQQLLDALPEAQFHSLLSNINQKAGVPIPPPTMNVEGMEVNLGRLFKAILSQGGSDMVSRIPNGWINVATTLGGMVHAQGNQRDLERLAMNLAELHKQLLAKFEVIWVTSMLARLAKPQTQSPAPLQGHQLPQQPPYNSPALNAAAQLPPNMNDPQTLARLNNMNSNQVEAIMRSIQAQQQQQQQMPPMPMQQQMPPQQFRPIQPAAPPAIAPQILMQERQPVQPSQLPAQRMTVDQFEFSAPPGYEEERNFVRQEYQKYLIQGFQGPQGPPRANLSETEKTAISSLLEVMRAPIKQAMQWMPLLARVHQKANVPRFIEYYFLFQDALQKSKMGIFHQDLAHWKKSQLFWIEVMNRAASAITAIKSTSSIPLQQQALALAAAKLPSSLAAPSPQIAQSQAAPGQDNSAVSGFSSEALISGLAMRPSLRQEDLKPPPMKRRNISKPPSQASSPQIHSIESPAKTPANAASPEVVEIPPPKPKAAAGKAATSAATPARGSLKRQRSISGQIKQPSTEEKKPINAAQPPKDETEAQKRARELQAAEPDPVPFLEKAWKDLGAVAPKQDGFLATSTFLSQDILGQFNFDDPFIPPVVRDASMLSFVNPISDSLEFFKGSTAADAKSKFEDAYDWSGLLKAADADGATPEFGRSPPSNNASPPDKDEQPPTPIFKELDMEPPSAFVRKTEFGSDADISKIKRSSDLEALFTDSFDWDAPLPTASWLLSPA